MFLSLSSRWQPALLCSESSKSAFVDPISSTTAIDSPLKLLPDEHRRQFGVPADRNRKCRRSTADDRGVPSPDSSPEHAPRKSPENAANGWKSRYEQSAISGQRSPDFLTGRWPTGTSKLQAEHNSTPSGSGALHAPAAALGAAFSLHQLLGQHFDVSSSEKGPTSSPLHESDSSASDLQMRMTSSAAECDKWSVPSLPPLSDVLKTNSVSASSMTSLSSLMPPLINTGNTAESVNRWFPAPPLPPPTLPVVQQSASSFAAARPWLDAASPWYQLFPVAQRHLLQVAVAAAASAAAAASGKPWRPIPKAACDARNEDGPPFHRDISAVNGMSPTAAAAAAAAAMAAQSTSGLQAKRLFGCPQCRYLTDRKNNLKRHVTTMHQESAGRTLECCAVQFRSKAALRDHVTIFHGAGYTCRHCARNFCRKALLKRHLAVHSGQKDYTCTRCDYATSHKSNLERHKKVHERVSQSTGNGFCAGTGVGEVESSDDGAGGDKVDYHVSDNMVDSSATGSAYRRRADPVAEQQQMFSGLSTHQFSIRGRHHTHSTAFPAMRRLRNDVVQPENEMTSSTSSHEPRWRKSETLLRGSVACSSDSPNAASAAAAAATSAASASPPSAHQQLKALTMSLSSSLSSVNKLSSESISHHSGRGLHEHRHHQTSPYHRHNHRSQQQQQPHQTHHHHLQQQQHRNLVSDSLPSSTASGRRDSNRQSNSDDDDRQRSRINGSMDDAIATNDTRADDEDDDEIINVVDDLVS